MISPMKTVTENQWGYVSGKVPALVHMLLYRLCALELDADAALNCGGGIAADRDNRIAIEN